jgi:saxitoxin biosynthesis operon SxtJ-like protein
MDRARLAARRMTKDQSKDTGMAMVLLLLILFIRFKRDELLLGALVLQVITMTAPRIFAPVAVVWLGVSHVLGTVMSTVILTAVFVLIVTPIGILRRAMGKDSLRLRAFKRGSESAMQRRNHVCSGADLERPY